MCMHFLAIRIALTIFNGSSSIKTISAASIAASEPRAPMATPISARESTGASLIPSPTKASFSFSTFLARSSSTFSTLSAGRSSLYTSSTFNSAATCFATGSASPVNMTVLRIPAFFSSRMASAECSFTTSAIRI